MKSVILLALWCLCSPLLAQVGAKVDQIVIPKSFGTSLVLKHCEALEVKGDGIKVKHDDGSYVVPYSNLPQPWKKWIAGRNSATDAAEKKDLEQAANSAKATAGSDNNPNWKVVLPQDGSEILRVRVVSVWDKAVVVELLKSAPPTADGKASVGYNASGVWAILAGNLPDDPVENQMYTVLGKKSDIRKFQGKDLQSYLVTRFAMGVAP